MPCRSMPSMCTCAMNRPLTVSQRVVTMRGPRLDFSIIARGHVSECTSTWLSSVTKPRHSSPGIGAQHDAVMKLAPFSS